jgi:hypothetical protein
MAIKQVMGQHAFLAENQTCHRTGLKTGNKWPDLSGNALPESDTRRAEAATGRNKLSNWPCTRAVLALSILDLIKKIK